MEEAPPENEICSICHGVFNVPCQANCSHWFCGNCIMLVWDHGSAFQPCKCPLCRREITMLVPEAASSRLRQDHRVAVILGKVETYNRRFGRNDSGIIQRMRDLPFFIRRLAREMMDPQRSLPLVLKARVYLAMLLSVLYVVSPVDFIPEAIVGILGYLDDVIIVLMCLLHVATLYRTVLFNRHGGS